MWLGNVSPYIDIHIYTYIEYLNKISCRQFWFYRKGDVLSPVARQQCTVVFVSYSYAFNTIMYMLCIYSSSSLFIMLQEITASKIKCVVSLIGIWSPRGRTVRYWGRRLYGHSLRCVRSSQTKTICTFWQARWVILL